MKKISTILIAAMLALTPLAFLSGCETGATAQGKDLAARGENVFTVDVLPGLGADIVKNAVLTALAQRQWTVTSVSDGRIAAELDATEKRGIHGIITITYNDKAVTITDASTDDKGNPFVPVRWMKYLQQSISSAMLVASAAK
jgi:hypothetical protein